MTTAALDKPAGDEGFRIERSIHVNAPPASAFALVNDFQQWVRWSPYEGLDANLKRTYSGAPQGVGAVYEWEGNNKVGNGRMEMLGSEPSRIVIKLDFFKPFEAHNTAEFSFVPEDGGSRVTWAMYGPPMKSSPLMKFVMSLFFNMEKVVGGQFEQGLAKLKTAAEAA